MANPIASYGTPTVVTDGATQTWDCTTSTSFSWTLGASRTMSAPSNPAPGQIIFIEVVQDATGSRLVTWPSTFAWATNGTAPTLTTTASRRDVLWGWWDNTRGKWNMATFGLNMV